MLKSKLSGLEYDYKSSETRYIFEVIYRLRGGNILYLLEVIAHDARNAVEVADLIAEANGSGRLNIETVTRGKEIS